MADQLFNGQQFRLLTLVDNFSRECLDWWAYLNKVTLDFSRLGKTNRQCVNAIVQRAGSPGMFKPALVFKSGRCSGTNRPVAAGLQRKPPT